MTQENPASRPEDGDYDLREANAHAELRPSLTPEFLATLVKTAETVGWGVDAIEVREFVSEVYRIAGQPMPDWKPRD